MKPENTLFRNLLIIADIEGSSGCWSYAGSSFLTPEWGRACLEMTKDVAVVVRALLDAGVSRIMVKDFHRTGYNILPERIDPRANVELGYRRGPVPGIGDPGNAGAVIFLGMHAASGGGGFLAHSFTSRIAKLEVNGKLMSEVEFFAASLGPYGIKPIFFSGCPLACDQAGAAIPGIVCHPIDKTPGPAEFDAPSWRAGLVKAATGSLSNKDTVPHLPAGPFKAMVSMRDGNQVAGKIARRWNFKCEGAKIFLDRGNISDLYDDLIRLCYLTPLAKKTLPAGLWLYDLLGRFGLAWVR
ncbi:M55 family metallopeptidase, partial [Thermodesulfobacteriota bacterium]